MSFSHINTLLLDLDGTLINSLPDLTSSVNVALRAMGLPLRTETEIRQWVGNGVDRLLHRAITGDINQNALAEQHQQAKRYFYDWYSDHSADQSHLYPGVMATLNALQAAGFKMACVTNKPERFTRPLLDRFNLGGLFQSVVGGDSTTTRKPDPQPLQVALQQLGTRAERAVMVGDSSNDLIAGKAAGTATVAVSWGYHQGVDLASLEPDAVIDRFDSLIKLLPKYLVNS